MKLFALLAITVLVALNSSVQGQQAVDRLQEIKDRGFLNCAVISTNSPIFAVMPSPGNYTGGFDVELCQAVATAIFGNKSAIKYIPATDVNRFELIQNGTADILSRTTTDTLTRRTIEQIYFAPTTFYDGQGFVVPAASPVSTFAQLDVAGETVCTLAGTTEAANAPVLLKNAQVIVKQTEAEDLAALISGECDAYTNDKSALASLLLANPTFQGRILPDTVSKEPLAMGTFNADGYRNLSLVMDAVVNGLFRAEELGISSQNVGTAANDTATSAEAKRLLGFNLDGSPFETGLPLSADFMANVLREVGNYGEIYAKNAQKGIPRQGTQNQLFTNGGLIYGIPWS